MTTTITRDEWLAEFERVANAGNTDDGGGMTMEEFAAATGHHKKWVGEVLKRLQPRVIVTYRRGRSISGRQMLTPCYRLKPEV